MCLSFSSLFTCLYPFASHGHPCSPNCRHPGGSAHAGTHADTHADTCANP
jgi:hypothetical protein